MIKPIKQVKEMRLDELIKYIFDNGIEDKVFPSNGGSSFDMCEARVSGSGNIKMSGYINEHTTFTVEEEETITEDTEFEQLIVIDTDRNITRLDNATIGGTVNGYIFVSKIYALIDGELQLVWEREDK